MAFRVARVVSFLILSMSLPAAWSTGRRALDVSATKTCASSLRLEFTPLGEDFIKVNGVAITGEFFYPVEMVLHNLGLDEEELGRFTGADLLSLGEGVSQLVPSLRGRGLNAKGLDLWYGSDDFPANYTGRLMQQYVRDHGDHLIAGDARHIPLNDETIDLVVSHMLVNNVDLETTKALLQDALRVTRKGGEIRIFGFDHGDVAPVTGHLRELYGETVVVQCEPKSWAWVFRGRTLTHNDHLLRVRKLRSSDQVIGAKDSR